MGKGRAEEDETKHVHCQKLSKRNSFVLPVRHRTGVALQTKSTEVSQILNRTELPMRHQEIRICYVEYDDQAEARAASSSRLVNSH